MDSLTAYGTAEYLAKAMRSFANKTYNMLLAPAFWERWLNEKVDHNGRPWKTKGAFKIHIDSFPSCVSLSDRRKGKGDKDGEKL